jgi:N-acetyl-gamma-glutamyl-phosphate reductase
MIKASVIGATGYAGAELVRNLLKHPDVEIKYLISKSYEGQRFCDIFTNILDCNIELCSLDVKKIALESDIVFCALPHGVSSNVCAELLKYDTKVIDLSGDLRYDDVETYEKWYGVKHENVKTMQNAIYGLSEISRDEISKASIVANPGCYTTCSITALYPLLKDNLIKTTGIIIDAKSGVTGAGRSAKTNLIFSEVDENIKAYGLANHRHTSEIEQEYSKACGKEVVISFTPHLIPVKRGILATCYAELDKDIDSKIIESAFEKYYLNCPFINFIGKNIPETKSVCGSNRIDIGYKVDERLNRIIVVSVLDNLIKGAGGQAIQNMNIMFGLDQTTGLEINGLYL